MVESKLVELVVAGSNPVGHPTPVRLMWSLLKEFLKFCKQEKKWWLAPLLVLLLVMGLIIAISTGPAIVSFMYGFL